MRQRERSTQRVQISSWPPVLLGLHRTESAASGSDFEHSLILSIQNTADPNRCASKTTAQNAARCRQSSVVFLRFPLRRRRLRVFPRRRHVLGIYPAIAAVAAGAFHALFEADEAAIAAAAT